MAALYLHNAMFTPEPSTSSSHTRTISSTTLRTITTDQSHPTEPLLQSDSTSGSLAYQDLLARQPGYPNGSGQRLEMPLSLDDLPAAYKEKQGHRKEQSVRKRLRILKLARIILLVILGVWALYNTIRYFLAYTIYDSPQGQAVALALGTSTAVCLALLICAAIVSAMQPYLIRSHIPIHSLLLARTIFRYLGSFFLLAPAIINLALTIAWRSSSVPELIPESRCHLAIDVVWSVTHGSCTSTSAAGWIGLSVFRVVFTLLIIITSLLTSAAYTRTRRPSQATHRRRRKRRMRPVRSAVGSPPLTASSEAPLRPSRQPSSSTVASQGNYFSPDRQSWRNSGTSTGPNPTSPPSSDDDVGSDSFSRSDAMLMHQRSNDASPSSSSSQDDRELNNFADRFRALISQISRETEEALQFAQVDVSDNPEPTLSPEDIYTSLPRRSYEEFGYPPDDHIVIMNGYVRRMPTIESLGSRELASVASSYWGEHDRFNTLSRPPTTRSVTEFTGSEPPSRANSLSLAAAMGGNGRSSSEVEVGELVDKGLERDECSSSKGSKGSTSRSTVSYYTAASNGRTSPPMTTPSSEHFPVHENVA